MSRDGVERSGFEFHAIADRAAWNALRDGAGASSVYGSWTWGEYKTRAGWSVTRLAVRDRGDGRTVAIAQVQTKRLPGVRVFVVQGGLHVIDVADEVYAAILLALRDDHLGARPSDLMLVNHYAGLTETAAVGLLRAGFSPILSSRMYTYVLDVAAGAEALEARLSRNWRHNLTRARKVDGLTARWAQSPAERQLALKTLAELYRALTVRKAFAAAIDVDLVRDLLVSDPDFVVVEALLNGEVVAVRVGYKGKHHMLDFLAASGDKARETYANYLLMWELVVHAAASGLSTVDCGGVDPFGNPGVFNFKKGLDAHLTPSGPLWLNSRSAFVRGAARLWLSREW